MTHTGFSLAELRPFGYTGEVTFAPGLAVPPGITHMRVQIGSVSEPWQVGYGPSGSQV